jgi:hypothetical protein
MSLDNNYSNGGQIKAKTQEAGLRLLSYLLSGCFDTQTVEYGHSLTLLVFIVKAPKP